MIITSSRKKDMITTLLKTDMAAGLASNRIDYQTQQGRIVR
jgi:hypothetical protein